MKRSKLHAALSILLILTLLLSQSCTQVATDPLSPIRIEVTGTTVNPVDIAWTIHNTSGALRSWILNTGSPVVIEEFVSPENFSEVSFAVSDSGATSNNAVLNGILATSASSGTEIIISLDADTEVPAGSGNFVVGQGDFFEDNAGNLMYILEDPAVNREILVSDVNGDFTPGNWTLFTSNRSEITVNILRDGVTLHTSSGSTDIGPVNLSYGSYTW